jgi:hypothetical protein
MLKTYSEIKLFSKCRQHISPKRRYSAARLHGVANQITTNFARKYYNSLPLHAIKFILNILGEAILSP